MKTENGSAGKIHIFFQHESALGVFRVLGPVRVRSGPVSGFVVDRPVLELESSNHIPRESMTWNLQVLPLYLYVHVDPYIYMDIHW